MNECAECSKVTRLVLCVQWVETHPQCNRMRLGDMQAKPHQRITKYPLLLKAVLKNTPEPEVQQTIRDMVRTSSIEACASGSVAQPVGLGTLQAICLG